MNKPRTSIAAIMFAALLPAAALAATITRTWTGGAGDGDWSTGDNWKNSAKPEAGEVASFPAGTLAVTAQEEVQFSKVDLNAETDLTLSGGPFVASEYKTSASSGKLSIGAASTYRIMSTTAAIQFQYPLELLPGSVLEHEKAPVKFLVYADFKSENATMPSLASMTVSKPSQVVFKNGNLGFGEAGYLTIESEDATVSFESMDAFTLPGSKTGNSLTVEGARSSLVLKDTVCTMSRPVSVTGDDARLVLAGANVRLNLGQYAATIGAAGGVASSAGIRFELPASQYAEAPVQKQAATKPANAFNLYGTAAVELDITALEKRPGDYPLIMDASKFAGAIADAGDSANWLATLNEKLVVYENGVAVVNRAMLLLNDTGDTLVAQIASGSGKATVDIPTLTPTEASYTGAEQKPAVSYDGELVELAWDNREWAWTNAGTWTVTATLKDAETTTWADGTTEPRELAFTIAPADNGWVRPPSLGSRVFRSGEGTTLDCGAAAFGDVVASYTEAELKALDPGAYEIAFTVAETANWSGLQTNITFAVRDASIPQPGDPDTSATDYTWTGGAAGVWYDLCNWTSLTSPCFGYPDSTEITSAKFTETAVVDGDTVYSSKVQALILPRDGELTLNAGNFEIGGQIVIPSGETVKLTIGRETSVTAAYSGNDQISIGGDTEVTVGVRGSLTLENATYLFSNGTKATLEVDGGTYSSTRYLSHGGETARLIARNGAEVTLSNPTFGETSFADSTLSCGIATIDAGKTLAATGSVVTIDELRMDGEGSAARFEDSAALAIAEVDFAKKNAVTNAVVEFKSVETTVTNVYFGGDSKYAVANARLVVDEAQLTVAEKLTIRDQASGCRIEFRGENPKLDLVKSYPCVFGKAGGETLENPNGLAFCLPSRPYASAPFVKEAGTGTDKGLSLYGNAALALDVANACEGGRYPLVCDKVGKFSVGIEDAGGEATYLAKLAAGLKVFKRGRKSSRPVVLTIEDDTLFATVKTQGLRILIK